MERWNGRNNAKTRRGQGAEGKKEMGENRKDETGFYTVHETV